MKKKLKIDYAFKSAFNFKHFSLKKIQIFCIYTYQLLLKIISLVCKWPLAILYPCRTNTSDWMCVWCLRPANSVMLLFQVIIDVDVEYVSDIRVCIMYRWFIDYNYFACSLAWGCWWVE